MHLTLIEVWPAISAGAVAWLMIRLGERRGLLALRSPGRCPACGRRRSGGGCRCTGR